LGGRAPRAPVGPRTPPPPGPPRPETATSIARAASIVLDDQDRRRLADRQPAWRLVRATADAAATGATTGEVVLVMGLAGAGKSTLAGRFVAEGYHRLNRDDRGGSLRGLLPALEQAAGEGVTRVVLDNTYASRASRAAVIDAASRLGLSARCVHLSTSLEDAQINVVTRMIARYGRLLEGEDLRRASRDDPGALGPSAQFRMQKLFEAPTLAEGFTAIETTPFERRWPSDYVHRALFVWCDRILMRSRSGARTPTSADDLEEMADRAEVLRRVRADDWRVIGLSWQPEIASGTRTIAGAEAVLARLRERLAVDMDMLYCPHAAGPPVCWCRKPLPGLPALAIHRYRLDPARCVYVGDGPQDPGFARRLGFSYSPAAEFFAGAASAPDVARRPDLTR
jgi:histidinol phosphatase-like enzyme/predicted kinase